MNQVPNKSILEKDIAPRIQGLCAFIGGIIFIFLGKATGFPGEKFVDAAPWTMGSALVLVYALFNSVFLISTPNLSKYLSESMVVYVILAILLGLVAYVVSGVSLNDAGTMKIIFMIATLGYMVFLGIAVIIKNMVQFLNKEEKDKIAGKKRKKRKNRR